MPTVEDLTRWNLLRAIWRLSLTVLVSLLIVSALAWPFLPEQVVIHYSGGQADASSRPTAAVLALPATLLAITALASIWIVAGPQEPSVRWRRGWFALLALVTVGHLMLVLGSFGG